MSKPARPTHDFKNAYNVLVLHVKSNKHKLKKIYGGIIVRT